MLSEDSLKKPSLRFAIAFLSLISFGCVLPTTPPGPAPSGTHSFNYTISGSATGILGLSLVDASGSIVVTGTAAVPYASSTYSIALTGSILPISISGTAIGGGEVSINVVTYEDGAVISSYLYSAKDSLSFIADSILR